MIPSKDRKNARKAYVRKVPSLRKGVSHAVLCRECGLNKTFNLKEICLACLDRVKPILERGFFRGK